MIRLLYDDAHMAFIYKPAGVLTHPVTANSDKFSVSAYCQSLWPAINCAIFPDNRPFIIHRLDQYTSGVLVVAKTLASLTALSAQFKARTVKKVYLAAVHGCMAQDSGHYQWPLYKQRTRSRYSIRAGQTDQAKPAVTHWSCIAKTGTKSILRLEPVTGRTHQLRVHCATAGHPIIGDTQYGRVSRAQRYYLEAHALSITHPQSHRRLTLVLPLPSWATLSYNRK